MRTFAEALTVQVVERSRLHSKICDEYARAIVQDLMNGTKRSKKLRKDVIHSGKQLRKLDF